MVVKGDVYAVARTLLVDGTIEGDLLASGGSLVIQGKVGQDARIAGGQVSVTGTIGRNLTVAGGNLELTRTGSVTGGLVAAAGNIIAGAPVGRDAKIAAGNLTVSNQISGNLHVAAGRIRMTSNAVLEGDLMVWSDEAPLIDDYAQLKGTVIHKSLPEFETPSREKLLGAVAAVWMFLKAMSFISTLILGLLLIYLFPSYEQTLAGSLRTRPWASLGVGFAVLVLAPVLSVMLAVTLVGAPLALILMGLYFIALYIARIPVLIWAGAAVAGLFKRSPRPGWALVIGLLIYSVVTLIPFVGGLICLFVLLFGLGALFLAKLEAYHSARRANIL